MAETASFQADWLAWDKTSVSLGRQSINIKNHRHVLMVPEIACGFVVLAGVLAFYCVHAVCRSRTLAEKARRLHGQVEADWKPKSRRENISDASRCMFDVLIVGGGSSGAGCALDAAARGLKVALIEAGDFGSETSSKSTKLLHGGVRYLEKAIRTFSIAQFCLLFEALSERYTVMKIAPYLSYVVPIMVPVYERCAVPYYWAMLKLYDKLSIMRSLGRSAFIGKSEAEMNFARLKSDNLVGAMVYYDGMFDDVRTNVMLMATSAFYGAKTLNHVVLDRFKKSKDGKIELALCTDRLTGQRIQIRARGFILAGGPFVDDLRKKEDTGSRRILANSAGTHVVYPAEYGPEQMGLVDSRTADGRLMFMLPWKGHMLAGSTETERRLESGIQPAEEDVMFLNNEIESYMNQELDPARLKAVWTGIRPLVKDGSVSSTESLIRSYRIVKSGKNLLSVTGGKWTTYRAMAEECIDTAVSSFGLHPSECCLTEYIQIIGSEGYARDLYYAIRGSLNIDTVYAEHLLRQYGSRAFRLKEYLDRYPERISSKYEFREGEVIYCIENEFACTVDDVLNNRFGVGFFDVVEASKMAAKVNNLMADYFSWSPKLARTQSEDIRTKLDGLGYKIVSKLQK